MDTPCRFFSAPNGCYRGDACTYRHDRPSGQKGAEADDVNGDGGIAISSTNPYSFSQSGGGLAPPPPRPCRFYSTGSCRNGNMCQFSHMGPPATPVGYSGVDDENEYAPNEYAAYYDYNGLMPGDAPPVMMMDAMHIGDAPTMQQQPPRGSDNGGATTPRRTLKIQANPQKKNYEVISEILPVLSRNIEGPFFAIDVECVATGHGNNDRDVARIAVVDEAENVFFHAYVKPEKDIVSYLTQLTGITESNLVDAPPLSEALIKLKAILPKDSVIVGQSIKKDLEWLTLEKDVDYKQMFDVAELFRIPMQSASGTIRYRYFSLRHVAKHLLGHNIQEADHDPVIDAKYAMKIFKQFRHLHESPGHRDAVYQTLLKTPRTPSFAERYPMIDGVAMRAPRKHGSSPMTREQPQHAHLANSHQL